MDERQRLLDYHAAVCKRSVELMFRKSVDYAQGGPFDNIMACETMGLASAEKGILIRLMDKISRLNSVTSRDECMVKDETVDDTIIDIINYAVIFGGVRCWKKAESQRYLTGSSGAPAKESSPPV